MACWIIFKFCSPIYHYIKSMLRLSIPRPRKFGVLIMVYARIEVSMLFRWYHMGIVLPQNLFDIHTPMVPRMLLIGDHLWHLEPWQRWRIINLSIIISRVGRNGCLFNFILHFSHFEIDNNVIVHLQRGYTTWTVFLLRYAYSLLLQRYSYSTLFCLNIIH